MSQEKYIMAIDQGTTSSRAIIFNKKGEKVSSSQKEFTQIFPQAGWVEHNPNEIWNSVQSVIAGAFIESGIKPGQRILDFQSTMPLSGSLAKQLL